MVKLKWLNYYIEIFFYLTWVQIDLIFSQYFLQFETSRIVASIGLRQFLLE